MLARFGLVPVWAKALGDIKSSFNARGETAATKPLFRGAFAKRRCLVPASAFYEWQAVGKGKQPHAIVKTDGSPLALAGLWERWQEPASGERLESFAIITTTPNALMAPLHDRMPVILAPEDWGTWLTAPADVAGALVKPCPADWLRAYPVSRAVGNVRNEGPALLGPLA